MPTATGGPFYSYAPDRLFGPCDLGFGEPELAYVLPSEIEAGNIRAVLNLGGTIEYFIENAFNYPTLAEAYKIAALDAWNRMPRPDC